MKQIRTMLLCVYILLICISDVVPSIFHSERKGDKKKQTLFGSMSINQVVCICTRNNCKHLLFSERTYERFIEVKFTIDQIWWKLHSMLETRKRMRSSSPSLVHTAIHWGWNIETQKETHMERGSFCQMLPSVYWYRLAWHLIILWAWTISRANYLDIDHIYVAIIPWFLWCAVSMQRANVLRFWSHSHKFTIVLIFTSYDECGKQEITHSANNVTCVERKSVMRTNIRS